MWHNAPKKIILHKKWPTKLDLVDAYISNKNGKYLNRIKKIQKNKLFKKIFKNTNQFVKIRSLLNEILSGKSNIEDIKKDRDDIIKKLAWDRDASLNYDGMGGTIKEMGETIFLGKKKNYKNEALRGMEDLLASHSGKDLRTKFEKAKNF